MSRLVELKLKDFGIDVEVNGTPGPVITRLNSIRPGRQGQSDREPAKDLARSLSVVSVRIVEVIRQVIRRLEIPNETGNSYARRNPQIARLRDMASPSTLALARTSGAIQRCRSCRMPHPLIAGTTGSGNLRRHQREVLASTRRNLSRCAIMIDPKMLELSVYEGIPHLLAPVVTDMKEASFAPVRREMDRRYALMAGSGCNIGGYNRRP